MNFEDKLISKIKVDRPKLKDSSIKLYIRNIKKLNILLGNKTFDNLDFLKNKSNVDAILKDKSKHTIKTYYASIVVVLMTDGYPSKLIKSYRDNMEELLKSFNTENEHQIKSENMQKNWLDWSEILAIANKIKKRVTLEGILDKTVLTNQEQKLLDNWLISSLYTVDPDNHPPIRLGYAGMIIIKEKDYLKSKDDKLNYLVIKSPSKKYFIFNDYKTDDSYGQIKIDVSKKLNKVLTEYLNFHNSKYLLLNNKDEELSSNGLTKALNSIFKITGRMISVSMLRHAYLTYKFPPVNTERIAVAKKMMHSKSTQIQYSKK